MPGDTFESGSKNAPLIFLIPGKKYKLVFINSTKSPTAFILMGMGMLMMPFVKGTLVCVWNITRTFMSYVNVILCIVLQVVLQIHYNINFPPFFYALLLFEIFIIAPHSWTPLVPSAQTSLYI